MKHTCNNKAGEQHASPPGHGAAVQGGRLPSQARGNGRSCPNVRSSCLKHAACKCLFQLEVRRGSAFVLAESQFEKLRSKTAACPSMSCFCCSELWFQCFARFPPACLWISGWSLQPSRFIAGYLVFRRKEREKERNPAQKYWEFTYSVLQHMVSLCSANMHFGLKCREAAWDYVYRERTKVHSILASILLFLDSRGCFPFPTMFQYN